MNSSIQVSSLLWRLLSETVFSDFKELSDLLQPKSSAIQSEVKPPEPDRVQNHVKRIQPLRRLVQREMPLHQP
jgi:hypothetical protein